jgi:hypothetical protein
LCSTASLVGDEIRYIGVALQGTMALSRLSVVLYASPDELGGF